MLLRSVAVAADDLGRSPTRLAGTPQSAPLRNGLLVDRSNERTERATI
jgi:hypothetical protein